MDSDQREYLEDLRATLWARAETLSSLITTGYHLNIHQMSVAEALVMLRYSVNYQRRRYQTLRGPRIAPGTQRVHR